MLFTFNQVLSNFLIAWHVEKIVFTVSLSFVKAAVATL